MVAEMTKVLGTVVLVKDGPVAYEATITDVKISYGSELYKVVPVAGCGSKWVKDFVGKGYPGSFNGAKGGAA